MIFNVIWTMFLFRGAASAAGNLPYDSGAFVSIGVGNLLDGLSHDTLETLEHVGLLLHIGVMLVFLILVLNSKHLHIFLAPLNVLFGRRPVALGAVKPLVSDGKPVTLDDIDDLDEDAKLGVGAVEDFSWKGILDFATCTECGRCQDQCPAWNTEKPLSPKLMIMAMRDASFAKAPYSLAGEAKREGVLEGNDTLTKEAARPLVGDTGDEWFYMPEDGSGVIDPDVLWSCVTCGACVQQCPVDIEHVDHIVDMRRYQVLVESNFPAELNQLFKGMENKGNPWNMSPTARMDWAKGLDFEVKVVGANPEKGASSPSTRSSGCSGSAAPAPTRTARRRRPGPWPSCSTWPASRSESSATGRPAPVTPPAGPATSSSSRASPSRTSRRSRSTRSRRSSRPAPTASTRSRTSTRTSASSSRSSTTRSCSTAWCARAS